MASTSRSAAAENHDAHRAGKFRIVAAWSTDLGVPKNLAVHLAVQDPSGDSAIIEYVKGKLVIHHGPEYRVMTNDPNYDEMIERMKQYEAFGGTKPLPGDSLEGEYRFARLAAYYKYLPDPKNYIEAVAGPMSLLRIAQVPFRDPAREPGNDQGIWARLIDIVCNSAQLDMNGEPNAILALKKRGFTQILDAEEKHLPNSAALIAALRRSIAAISS